jgi:hypothetical protein
MGSFGQYLLKKKVLGREQIEEATQVMVVFGGRLGTILVEAGHLTPEALERELSAFLDVPCAPVERLAAPEPKALELIPRDVAQRHSVLPLWLEKRTLHMAMLDARDPNRIDELAFSTGLSIEPYVIGERRLVELLERHYGIRPDSRFTDFRILELAGHYRPVRQRDAESGAGAETPRKRAQRCPKQKLEAVERERIALGIAPLADDEELSAEDAVWSLPEEDTGQAAPALIELTVEAGPGASDESQADSPPAATGAPRLQPAADAAEVARLEGELVFLAEREQIPALTLRIATFFARTAALFIVRAPMIQGALAAGDVRSEQIEGLFLPLASDSALARAAETGTRFRGPPTGSPVDAGIARVLRGVDPKELAVLPVCLGERTVNLIYADNGDEALPETSLAALDALSDVVTAAYRRLVLEGKRRHC